MSFTRMPCEVGEASGAVSCVRFFERMVEKHNIQPLPKVEKKPAPQLAALGAVKPLITGHFSEKELALVKECAAKGETPEQIAKRLHRRSCGVGVIMRRLGLYRSENELIYKKYAKRRNELRRHQRAQLKEAA